MKIAHVCAFYTPAIGGVKQVVEELAKRQVKEGHEVHVFTSDWDKEKRIKIKNEIIDGVHIHRCFHIAKVANFESIWPSVFPKLMKGKFDIIHSHVFGHVYFVLSALAAKLSGAKHFHTTHCPWTNAHRSAMGRIGLFLSYNIFSRLAVRFTEKIIAITPWEFDFIKKYGGTKKQIVNLPNGMANEFFIKKEPNDFKKKYGIKGRLVLFFGRLNITKGPEKFVEIAKMILKERDDVMFFMRDNKIVLVIRSNYGIRPDEINPMYWGEYLNIIDEELFVPFPDMGHYIQLESFSSICPKTGHINELEYNDSNEKWSWKPL